MREMDNTGLNEPKVCFLDVSGLVVIDQTLGTQMRYEVFMRVMRQWRFLKMLKCSGRGHDPAGINATGVGECAVLCPACPQPRINLPEGWEKSLPSVRCVPSHIPWHNLTEEYRWRYTLFLAIDANFQLQQWLVSSDSIDPGLGRGFSYFVEQSNYTVYLETRKTTVQEVSYLPSRSFSGLHDEPSAALVLVTML